MGSDGTVFPHIAWVLEHQSPVAWIYVTLISCLIVRLWLSLRLHTLTHGRRQRFLHRTATLSETTANVALLFGVLGTLIGVAAAVAGRSGNVQAGELMNTFSNAFGIAVSTTIAGGLTYVVCYLLSSIDDYLGER